MRLAAEILLREAERWKAVGEEHTDADSGGRMMFELAETVCRQVAGALEAEKNEELEAA